MPSYILTSLRDTTAARVLIDDNAPCTLPEHVYATDTLAMLGLVDHYGRTTALGEQVANALSHA